MPILTVQRSRRTLSRRAVLKALGLAAAGLAAAACSGGAESQEGAPAAAGSAADFSARFAAYQPTDEPNGDLSKVAWPAFVTRAGSEVKQLYEFQITNGELMKFMPCFCGCGGDGHHNNRDCYVKAVNPDGSVVFDSMAPT
jgi:hypothetical protein